MKIYSKLFLYGIIGALTCVLFAQTATAAQRVVERNQMTTMGLHRMVDNSVEIYFHHQGQIFYFPTIEGPDSIVKGENLIQLLRQCRRITIHDYTPPSPGTSVVPFAHYSLSF